MADTIRTQAQIIASLIQDGQTAGISAQDFRDIVVSIMGCYGGMSLYNESGQAHGNSGSITTSFEKLDTFDTDDASDNVTPDETTDQDLTIGTNGDGDYLVSFNISFLGTASTAYIFQLYKNAGAIDRGCSVDVNATPDVAHCGFTTTLALAAADVLQMQLKCDGASKSLTAYQCNFSIKRIG